MSAILPRLAAQGLPPRNVSGGICPRQFSDGLVEAVKAAVAGDWMRLRPAGCSVDRWKDIQQHRRPMKVADLAHLFEKDPRARGAVLAFMTERTERDRRRGPRRVRAAGRRAVDGVSR